MLTELARLTILPELARLTELTCSTVYKVNSVDRVEW